MKKLLILNGSHSEITLIQAAKQLGYYVITSGNNPQLMGHKYADEYIPADYSDKEKILQLVKENGIDRIVSCANDFGVITASYVAEKMGWMKVIRWFGCIGMALSSLAFYYLPQHFGHNFAMALVPAIALGIFVAAFVPMAAVFPALEPNHKGAAISVYNLSAGLSNFLAPAIAVVLLPYFSTIGVVIAYTALYILAFFLCPLIRVEQPGFTSDQHAKPFTANAAES